MSNEASGFECSGCGSTGIADVMAWIMDEETGEYIGLDLHCRQCEAVTRHLREENE